MTTNQTPLNHEALEAAAKAIFDVRDDEFDLEDWDDLGATERERYECDARAALSAYLPVAQPVVNRVEEIYALPDGSVLANKHGYIGIIKDGWVHEGQGRPITLVYVQEFFLPATVLQRPEADDA